MKSSVAVLFCAALSLISLQNAAGLQENCKMDSASRNSPLAGAFKSTKEGAIYSCRCDTTADCSTYSCSKDPEEEEEGLAGEPVGEAGERQIVEITIIEPESETEEIPTTAAPTGCRDSVSGITYNIGEKFTKVGTEQQSCTCNADGSIACKESLKTCPLPESPEPEYDPYFVPPRYGCYDPWGKRWYRNYQSWDRKRLMNDVKDQNEEIFETYRCSCSMGRTQCSARDIPCCDRSTGQFVGGGERFLTSMSGANYICTCQMQRGRFDQCYPEHLESKQAGSTSSSYRPAPQVKCRDRYDQGKLYNNGETWIQWRTRGYNREPWTCTCVVSGRHGRTKCHFGARSISQD